MPARNAGQFLALRPGVNPRENLIKLAEDALQLDLRAPLLNDCEAGESRGSLPRNVRPWPRRWRNFPLFH